MVGSPGVTNLTETKVSYPNLSSNACCSVAIPSQVTRLLAHNIPTRTGKGENYVKALPSGKWHTALINKGINRLIKKGMATKYVSNKGAEKKTIA